MVEFHQGTVADKYSDEFTVYRYDPSGQPGKRQKKSRYKRWTIKIVDNTNNVNIFCLKEKGTKIYDGGYTLNTYRCLGNTYYI